MNMIHLEYNMNTYGPRMTDYNTLQSQNLFNHNWTALPWAQAQAYSYICTSTFPTSATFLGWPFCHF
jgi:hypothetical protein